MKKALVLEGGGLRGAYTAGALAWFLKEEISFDYAAGISSGAQHLSYYISKDANALKKMAVVAGAEQLSVGLKPLFKEGQLVGYNQLQDYVVTHVPLNFDSIKSNSTEGEIGIFDLEAGVTRWVNIKDLDSNFEMLKAASLIPIAGKAVTLDGKKYVDAGVEHMIPIKRSLEKGMDKHVVITTKPKSYERSETGWPTNLFMSLFYRKYKAFRQMVKDRKKIYYEQKGLIDQLEKEGKALELYPSKTFDIGRFGGDREQLEDLFKLGFEDCEAKRDEIYQFLELDKREVE